MRSYIVLAGVVMVAAGQAAFSAETASKPVMVSAASAKQATKASASRVTRETVIPEGSLEAFGSVGLPQ